MSGGLREQMPVYVLLTAVTLPLSGTFTLGEQ